MLRALAALCLGILAPLAAKAEQIGGTWHGQLERYTYSEPRRTLVVGTEGSNPSCTWDEIGKTSNAPAPCAVTDKQINLTTGSGSKVALLLDGDVLRGTFTLKSGENFQIVMRRTPVAAVALPAQAMPPQFVKLSERNFKWVKEEGEGRCLFGQFDVENQLKNVRGPCSIDSPTVEALQGGSTLRFTVTAQSGGIEYPKSTFDMACRRNDAFWASIGVNTPGRGMLCRVIKLTLPDGTDLPAWRRWGFYLIRLTDDGLYYPMTGYEAPWLDMNKVQGRGFYPSGMP